MYPPRPKKLPAAAAVVAFAIGTLAPAGAFADGHGDAHGPDTSHMHRGEGHGMEGMEMGGHGHQMEEMEMGGPGHQMEGMEMGGPGEHGTTLGGHGEHGTTPGGHSNGHGNAAVDQKRPLGLVLGGFLAFNALVLVAAALLRRRPAAIKRRKTLDRVRRAAGTPEPEPTGEAWS